jgi:hypothetical protein
MTLQELAQMLALGKKCKDCKFAKKIKSFDWRCTFEDNRQEIHPLLPVCENFQPKESKNEKNSCA